jgi:hypothetical protein
MKKKVKLFYGLFALFVLILASINLNSLLHVNANAVLDEKEDVEGFSIIINSYTSDQDQLSIDYTIFNAATESKEIEVTYQLLDIEGNYLKEGVNEIIFDPSTDSNYRLSIPIQTAGQITKLRLYAFNGAITTEAEEVLDLKNKITGFVIFEDKENTSNLIVAILLIGAILVVSRKIYTLSATSRELSGVKDNLIPLKIN